MCIIASSVSITGSREHRRAAERLVRLQVGWEKAGEGNPDDPAQARRRMSEHVKVVGVRHVAHDSIPGTARKNLEDRSWAAQPTWRRKLKRESSMVRTRCFLTKALQGPCDMVKARLLESPSPFGASIPPLITSVSHHTWAKPYGSCTLQEVSNG